MDYEIQEPVRKTRPHPKSPRCVDPTPARTQLRILWRSPRRRQTLQWGVGNAARMRAAASSSSRRDRWGVKPGGIIRPKPSPRQRGKTCRWVWKTDWNAARPSARKKSIPSHLRPEARIAPATRMARRNISAPTSGSRSASPSECRTGATSTCPGFTAPMVMNAATVSPR